MFFRLYHQIGPEEETCNPVWVGGSLLPLDHDFVRRFAAGALGARTPELAPAVSLSDLELESPEVPQRR